jgi:hypothetical protein
MKKIIFFLLSLIALVTHAQTTTCKTDTLQPGYYQDSVKFSTVLVPQLCTDTVGYNYFTSNCRRVKVTQKLFSRVRVCDTIKIPITTTRDCSTSFIRPDTLRNYFYFPPLTNTTCVTTYPTVFGRKAAGHNKRSVTCAKKIGYIVE